MTHGGTLAARTLHDLGVGTVFAVPGGHVLHLLDGCLDAGIRVIDTRHEGAAALAAEGWALATGEVGIAIATAGPGFANAFIGLMDAGVWTLPLVLIGGRTGLDKQGIGAVMDVDQAGAATPVVKRVVRCTRTERIPQAVAEAVHTARSGRPGPVYLEIPMDIYGAEAGGSDEPQLAGVPGTPLVAAPESEAIDAALEALEGAERPIAIAGGGAFWSGAGEALARFAERTGVPVITTSAGRGVLPDGHPGCLGSLIHGGVAAISADVVLVLGSRFDANLAFGGAPLFQPTQTIVQVDIEPASLGGNRRPDIPVVGDVTEVLTALTDRWRKDADTGWREQARELCGHMLRSWDEQIESHEGERVHAGAVARELVAFARETAGDGVTFVADGGDALTWGLAYTYAERPGRVLSTTTALGTLGVGMPFALAAAAARPDEPVFLFTGDGSFGLTAMEVDTCVRHGLPVVTVVSNNGSWGDVAHEQDNWFSPGRHVASELAFTRYDRLAEALGGHGEHVTALEELRPALERAVASGTAAVVNVETDPAVLSELLQNLGELGVM